MAKTIVGLFDTFRSAQSAVDELIRSGFKRENVSLVATEQARTTAGTTTDDTSDAGTGAAVGATTGAVVGGAAGLIASLAGLTIPVIGPIVAAGPIIATLSGAGVGALAGGLIGALVNAGVPEEEARYYEEGVKRGGTLVTITADDAMAERAADIMDKHGAVDIRRRMAEWKSGQSAETETTGTSTGWAGKGVTGEESGASGRAFAGESQTGIGQAATTGATESYAERTDVNRDKDQLRVPVVEEEIAIGKRQVETGGVRVETNVTETPVQEEVTLREEKVNVERRPVDRPATAADLRSQPGEESIEFRERREEPVVQKSARVVEEVVVNKEERERTETVRDTVRRKDVDVQQVGGQPGESSARRFEDYDSDFRTYHTSAFSSAGDYDTYAPAYRYGYTLGGNRTYAGKDWNSIESDARRDWESRNPGTWERFKDQVRYAWDRTKEKVS